MSNCSCIVVETDTGYWDFKTITTPKARKIHICSECKGAIMPGETYENMKGSWDGDFTQNKTCPDCLSIRKVLFCGRWSYGGLFEDLYNAIDSGDNGFMLCLGDLTPRAREKVCELVENYWEEWDE